MMSKNSIVPFLKDYLIKFLTRPFLLDTNDTDKRFDHKCPEDLQFTLRVVFSFSFPHKIHLKIHL